MSRTVVVLCLCLGLSSVAGSATADEETPPAAAAEQPDGRVLTIFTATLDRYLEDADRAQVAGFAASSSVSSAQAAFVASDRALRTIAPIALRAQGFDIAAETLEDLAPITDAASAQRAYEVATGLYPEIPFRASTGLAVSQAESAVLAAISSARTLATANVSSGALPLRDRVKLEMASGQAARAAGHALRSTRDRSAVITAIVSLLGSIGSRPEPAAATGVSVNETATSPHG